MRRIAQPVERWGAAFVVDPDGITRTKPLRPARMGVPASEPVAAPHRAAFVHDAGIESTVDLASHRADADLDELDPGDEIPEAV